MTDYIPAVETGLSSDPEMNWAIPELTGKAIVSFSDAHSLPKLGRELTVFAGQPDYQGLSTGLWDDRIDFTIEMYPEEGKYHYDGHRNCGVSWHPEQSNRNGDRCPQCRRPLTLGVLHRALELAEAVPRRQQTPQEEGDNNLPAGLVYSAAGRPPFARMVPLLDIIAALRGRGPNTKGVLAEYMNLVSGIRFRITGTALGRRRRSAAGSQPRLV